MENEICRSDTVLLVKNDILLEVLDLEESGFNFGELKSEIVSFDTSPYIGKKTLAEFRQDLKDVFLKYLIM